MLGGMLTPTARCARRPWVGATAFHFSLRGGTRAPTLAQGLPPPDGSTEPPVAPTHGRRNVPANGPLRSPTMGRRYRFSFFITWRAARADADSGTLSPRRVNGATGSADPWSAECFRQRPATLADHGSALPLFFFHYVAGRARTVRAGREGLVGALSAMDGAKRGPHGCSPCRPPPTPPARPTPRTPLSATHHEGLRRSLPTNSQQKTRPKPGFSRAIKRRIDYSPAA